MITRLVTRACHCRPDSGEVERPMLRREVVPDGIIGPRTPASCLVRTKGRIRQWTCLSVWTSARTKRRSVSSTKLSGDIALVGLEACPLSEWMYGALHDAGYPVFCIETRHTQRFLSTRPNKTDRNDGHGIATMMRVGHFKPVHVKIREPQLVRSLHRPPPVHVRDAADREHDPQPIADAGAEAGSHPPLQVQASVSGNCANKSR